jgi:hypothetical protein
LEGSTWVVALIRVFYTDERIWVPVNLDNVL